MAAAKVVDGKHAAVRADAAVRVGKLDLQVVDGLAVKQGGYTVNTCAVAGEKSGAVGTHDTCNIRTDDVSAGEQLKSTERCIGHEGTTLNNAVLANLAEVAELDDLEQGVLDDGVRKTGSNVADGCAFLLRLLNAGVHEDGTARAQVNRECCLGCGGCKLADVHLHGVGKGCNKGTAACRASLVQHDVLNDAVFDLQTLHVLAANIKNEINVWDKCLSATQVSNSLNLARVCAESLNQDALAITGGCDVANNAVGRHLVVDGVHNFASGTQNVAVVIVVPGVKKLALLANNSSLHSGRTCVDANEHASVVVGQLAFGDYLLVVAGLEVIKVLLSGKEWVKTSNLGALDVLEVVQCVHDLRKGDWSVRLARQSSARCNKEVGVLWQDDVLVVQVKRDVEATAQLREVLQRAAEKRDVAADRVTTGQARDGLVCNSLEDGSGDVGRSGTLVEQRLNVGLSKNAAARCNWVDLLDIFCQLVEAGCVGLEKRRHLVDERTGTTCAGTIHALLNTVVKVDDLCVLAAQLNSNVGLRDQRLNGALGSDNLLDKLQVKPLRQEHSAGTGDCGVHRCLANVLLSFDEQGARGCANVGVVTLVVCVNQRAVLVDDGQLYGCGTNVDAQHKVGLRQVKWDVWCKLGTILYQLKLWTNHCFPLREQELQAQIVEHLA